MAKIKNSYNDESMEFYEGVEAIRQRFDMYVGAKATASFHLVKEVLDNSVDENLNGFSDRITVEYFPKINKIVIEDNGRGLPTGMNKKLNVPTIEMLFTKIHSGGKFSKKSFKVSGGKNGVGVKATNALSKELIVESFRDGEHYRMSFEQGKVIEKLTKIGKTNKKGTKLSFIPDPEILEEYSIIDIELLKQELDKRAYINAGLTLELKVGKEKFVFVHPNGIKDYLADLNKDPMSDTIDFSFTDKKENQYEVVFNYANTTGETIKSFVNGIVTSKGTHETGFKTGLTNAMNEYIKANNLLPKKLEKIEIKGEDIREGLFAVINIRHILPEFKGQVKDELSNNDVLGELRRVTQEKTSEWLNANPEVAKKVINRIIAFAKGRNDANSIKDKIVNINNGSSGLSFPATFADCDSRDIKENEVIIIEGKSAGGNVKTARDPLTQAVFSLRGKPLNSYNSSNARILLNNEYKELIKVIFGTTDLKNINYENIRYGKIVILADADDDGFHIVCLLLAFFHEHFRQLIEDGRIHIALSPLYRITKGGKFIYFKNDLEYDNFISKEISTKFKVVNDQDKEINMTKFISTGTEYLTRFSIIREKYHIDNDILNLIENYNSVTSDIFSKDIISALKDLGLMVEDSSDGLKIEGLFNDMWHNFIIDKEFEKDIQLLSKIYPKLDTVNILDKKNNTKENDMYIYDTLMMLTNTIKFERVRFKGLGESDADELFETTLNPNNRDMVQVNIEDFEESSELTKVLFGNNADLRKEFIVKHL